MTSIMRSLAQICLILWLMHSHARAELNLCESRFDLPSSTKISINSEYFNSLADLIETHRQEFINALVEIDNYKGAEYEVEQAIKTLRGVQYHELHYLKRINGLKNIAIYGSTNIPLYTLVLHAIIPASTGAQVWFRTPERSRQTYLKLFSLIEKYSPKDLSNINILHEKRDVQYDDFRRKYVLRLTKKRRNFLDEDGPAEVVLFTGKPETGNNIRERNLEKLKQVGFRGKQLFLQFGTGLNPVVITDRAEPLVDKIINDTTLSIQINTSQDCIAPKFYLLDSSLSHRYLELLLNKISNLHFGLPNSEGADYSPLTFSESLDDLVGFREKYAKYLKTPDAVIDRASRRVDPHVFVFPFSMFNEVPLVDHYAPFLIHFIYDDQDQLLTAANDSRVRKRAMFATIYGEHGDTALVHVRKAFEDNFHTTIMNQSVFVEESGNFPFGGYSGDASSLSLISGNSDGVLEFNFHRPLLFSREVAEFFSVTLESPSTSLLKPDGTPRDDLLADLMARGSFTIEGENQGLSLSGIQLPENHDWVSLSELREASLRYGQYTYVHKNPPQSIEEEDSDRLMYGENVIYRNTGTPLEVPGVVLHPSFAGKEVRNLNAVRGSFNPHLGYLSFQDILRDDKDAERQLVEAILPGAMPKSTSLKRFFDENEEPFTRFERARNHALALISSRNFEELKPLLTGLVRDLFTSINGQFPRGAFLKNFDEWATGDLGNQVTSFSQNEDYLVWEFIHHLERYLSGRRNLEETLDLKSVIENQHYASGLKFIVQLLMDHDQILVQERVQLASTQLGFPLEFRVDFLYGQAIASNLRYSHEFYPVEADEAKAALNQFFAQAPTEIKMLSGGADVAQLASGQYVILEFNFGASSGSLLPEIFPVRSNLIKSNLQGRQTPLIEKLEGIFDQGLEAQKTYLLSLQEETDLWIKRNIAQMSRSEVARYFRDRYLQEWSKNPSTSTKDSLIQRLTTLLTPVFSNNTRDGDLLLKGAENYMSLTLMRRDNESL